MMSSFRIPPNRHLAMIVVAIFAVGLGMGAVGTMLVYRQKVNDLERTTASLSAFNQAQAKTISQLSLDQSMPKSAIPAASAPVAAPAAPQVAQANLPAPTVTAPVAAVAPAPTPHKPQARVAAPPVPRQEPPKPVAAPVTSAPVRTTPAQAIEALKQQKSATPTPATPPPPTTVTMQQAGIAGIDTASVKFASGRVVNVGGEFPTGEKLISVSPTDGRIVTDRRIIQLAKPAPVQ